MLKKRCRCTRDAWAKCKHPWWYRFQVGNREYGGSTHTHSRRDADVVERARRAEADSNPGKQRRAAGDYTLADVRQLDIERREKRIKRRGTGNTREITQHWAAIFKVIHETTPAHLVTGKLAVAYEERRRAEKTNLGEPVRGATIRRHLKTLRRGLALAYAKGWITKTPVDWPDIEADDEPSQALAGRVHHADAIAGWLSELTQDARDEAELIVCTSLRGEQGKRWLHDWNEVRTTGADIKNVPALVRFPRGSAKHKKRVMIIPLTARAWDIVERRRRNNTERPFVLPQENHRPPYRSAVRRALATEIKRLEGLGMTTDAAEADARKRGFGERIKRRDLRHHFATLAERFTQDRKAVADIMGHTTMRTTERYLHSDEERVVAAMAATDRAMAGTFWPGHSPESGSAGDDVTPHEVDFTAELSGAQDRTRTDDLLITNQHHVADSDVSPRKYSTQTYQQMLKKQRFSFMGRDRGRDIIRRARFSWGGLELGGRRL
jgi:hypothetical protein